LWVAASTTAISSADLIEESSWSRVQFSLVGLTMFLTLLALPLVGRLTDRFGVRPMAFAGALLLPLCFLIHSAKTGRFSMFVALAAMVLATSSTISPTVWCRLIAERFTRSRGLAPFIVMAIPACVGAILP
jgi:MFS family permease